MTRTGGAAPLQDETVEASARPVAAPALTPVIERHSDSILNRLMALHPKVIDLGLGRTLDLLERLGRPQDRLPPVVHVAGTNGKGSTIAFLRAMLEQAGYRVHVYTSPHLVRFAERIRLAGALIEEEHLAALLEECEQANEGRPITFFEITTCAAFKAFADTPADILLLEVGMGGRLDSTNVVDRPVCTAITPVSMDHMQFLGDTIGKIAAEKAGIQKPGVDCVIAPQHPDAAQVIADHATRVGAPLLQALPDTAATLGLPGDHQTVNAGVARAVAGVLNRHGFRIDEGAMTRGLAAPEWPGRLQRLTHGPVLDQLRAAGLDGWEVWLDGGHNAAAGAVLAGMAGARWQDAPLHLICGMLSTKDPDGFFSPLAPFATDMTAIPIPGEANTTDPEILAGHAARAGHDARTAPGLAEAVAAIIAAAAPPTEPPPGRILICGSLYLAGTVLSQHG